MARVTIGGTAYELRPFKFRELRQAAPAIDRIAAQARGGGGGLAVMAEGLADVLEVLAIALQGETAEHLAAELAMTEVAGVQAAFASLLKESGLKPAGEPEPAPILVPAPADPAGGDPSQTRSTTSSPNSSGPAAATGIG